MSQYDNRENGVVVINPRTGNLDKRVSPHGAKKGMKWKPVTWTPLYESWVLMSCKGYKNTEIAKLTGRTHIFVGMVLRSPEAREIKLKVIQNLRKESTETLPERLGNLEQRAIKHLETVLNDEELAMSKPFMVFDRSLSLLKSLSKNFKTDTAVTVNNTNQSLVLTPEAAKIMTSGMEKANEAYLLHSGKNKGNKE